MEKNNFFNNSLITLNQTFDYYNGDRISSVLSATRNFSHINGVPNPTKHNFDSSISNSPSPVDRSSRNSSLRSPGLSSLEADDFLDKITEELRNDFSCNLQVRMQLPRGIAIFVEVFNIKRGKPIDVVSTSLYCNSQLLRIRNEMIEVYGPRKYNIASTDFVDKPKDDFRNYCDFTSLYLKKDNNSAQRTCFKMIRCKLRDLEEGEYLKLIGFPLLTKFNNDVLCIMREVFKEVLFYAPNTLMLVYLKTDKLAFWHDKLAQVEEAYTSERAVISFLPANYETGADYSFHKWVFDVNNFRLFHEINRVIYLRPQA